MEENIAILMADLSGYTALTETHGSVSAADIIDRYVAIAKQCLVGKCRLHDRTGDEIMIVSSSADDLLATAMLIKKTTADEEHFLLVHGGMHYGKVLKRTGNYFGSAVNLTSRIAAIAAAGNFYCSAEFINALSNRKGFDVHSKGNHSFKNIIEETELFELSNKNNQPFYIDPVCRMILLNPAKAITHPKEHSLHFCSSYCLDLYNHHKINK